MKAKDDALNATLHVNRAAVNLELKNYRSVLNDCAEALKLDPNNVKAFYRAAKACFSLGKMDDALDAVKRGLKVEPENAALKGEQARIQAKVTEQKAKEAEKLKQEREAKMAELRLNQVIRQRNLKMRGKPKIDDAKVRLDPTTNRLMWPVFFLYPEHKESDFVRAFDEADTLDDQIYTMFEEPAPWDEAKEYRPDNVEIYIEDADSDGKRLYRVPSDKMLGVILMSKGFVIVDGTPSFLVVPKQGEARKRFLSRYTEIKPLPMV